MDLDGLCSRLSGLVVSLNSVRGTDFQLAFTTSGLSKDLRATFADDDVLGVAIHGGNRVAAGALNIHEIRVGGLNESLELVLSLFFLKSGV